MKTKGLGWKENHIIQNIGTEDSKGNLIADKRQILKIREYCVIEISDPPNQPDNLQVEHEEEADAD